MSAPQQIDMQVDYHPSERLTLKERNDGEIVWSDVRESGLSGNSDAASFYQHVARRLADHAQSGIVVSSYKDTGPSRLPKF